MPDDLALKPATELLELFRTRKASPVEAVKALLTRIERLDPLLNAFRVVDNEGALTDARASEARWAKDSPIGLIDGIPTSIKDSHYTIGFSTRHGSRLTSMDVSEYDSPHVARLREHGAVILGKTNLCEQGWKTVTDSPLTGISRNPWNTAMTPGGSSGGAAIAAAAGLGTINMGGDGGGSIRVPASFCGIFGIKPTYGRVPRYPQESLITCAHFGPLTRTVSDSALVMNVITRPSTRDVTALAYDDHDYLAGLDRDIQGLRIGYCEKLGGDVPVDKEVASSVRKAAYHLKDADAIVEEANPGLGDTFEAYKILNSAYQVPKTHGKTAEQLALMDPGLVANARIGETLTVYDLLRAGYERASWVEKLAKFFSTYDVLITPTTPVTAFEVGRNNPAHLEDLVSEEERVYSLFNNFLYQTNYTHHPAASVPCGITKSGLPIGLQIITACGADQLALSVARSLERINPFPDLPKL